MGTVLNLSANGEYRLGTVLNLIANSDYSFGDSSQFKCINVKKGNSSFKNS